MNLAALQVNHHQALFGVIRRKKLHHKVALLLTLERRNDEAPTMFHCYFGSSFLFLAYQATCGAYKLDGCSR
jgi:hypothetical protein